MEVVVDNIILKLSKIDALELRKDISIWSPYRLFLCNILILIRYWYIYIA